MFLSHCEKSPHSDEHDVEVELSDLEVPEVIDVAIEGMLDRSWVCDVTDYEADVIETSLYDHDRLLMADYQTDLLDSVPLVQDNFMSLLCSLNTDLKLEDVEDMQEDQMTPADNIMV